MISVTAEYALLAVIYLAGHTEGPRTVKQIAAETRVPVDYLSKVLQELSGGGIVRSQRGLHGGFSLAGPALALSMYDVIEVVSPLPDLDRCPKGNEAHSGRLCLLHRLLGEITERVKQSFRQTTITELVDLCSSEGFTAADLQIRDSASGHRVEPAAR